MSLWFAVLYGSDSRWYARIGVISHLFALFCMMLAHLRKTLYLFLYYPSFNSFVLVFKADEAVGGILKALLPRDDSSPGTSGLQCRSHGSISPSEHVNKSEDMESDTSSSDYPESRRTGSPTRHNSCVIDLISPPRSGTNTSTPVQSPILEESMYSPSDGELSILNVSCYFAYNYLRADLSRVRYCLIAFMNSTMMSVSAQPCV